MSYRLARATLRAHVDIGARGAKCAYTRRAAIAGAALRVAGAAVRAGAGRRQAQAVDREAGSEAVNAVASRWDDQAGVASRRGDERRGGHEAHCGHYERTKMCPFSPTPKLLF